MAAVLKSDTIGKESGVHVPVAFNVEDVQNRARQYLAEIQREADQLLQQAQAEAQRIRHAAKQQGLAEAESSVEQRIQEAAQKLSDQRCRTAIATCEASVAQLTQDTADWLAMWRNQTVELASKMAEKIVRREMEENEELLRVWLEEALVALRDVRDVRVLVHPDDFAVAGRFLQHLAKTIPQAASVEIIPDPDIPMGECLVRSQHGQIDQQLTTQLQRLVDQLS